MHFSLYDEFQPSLADEWNTLLDESITHVPFLRYEYLQAWWQTRGGGEWPETAKLVLITARRDGALVGAVPLFHTFWNGKPSLLLVGSIEVSDYLDILACPEDVEEFVNGLLPFLTQTDLPEWQVLDLYNVLESSPSLAAFEKAAQNLGWQSTQQQLQHSPYIKLPGDWEVYLSGIDKKQRHEIRRKMRRLEESGIPHRWYIVQDLSSLPDEVNAFMTLMTKDPDKAKFLTPAMREHMQLTCQCAMQNGCLQLAFLEINGQKAAGYLSMDYLNRLWVYNSGIDPAFMEYSPGWVLLGHLLKWANESGRTEFDFMRGDEEYKYRFGGIDRFVTRLTLGFPLFEINK
jgi:CelD/BcsL family acetyltransferase involved in cellulose biosynthesis